MRNDRKVNFKPGEKDDRHYGSVSLGCRRPTRHLDFWYSLPRRLGSVRTLATSLSKKIDPKMWPISVKDKLRVDPNLSTHCEPSEHTGKHEKAYAT